MLFNSLSFFLFFALFFVGYWRLRKQLKAQNVFLLLASYVFYAWADWRFLPYLAGVSLLNYALGIMIERTDDARRKRLLVWIGLLQGIGALAFFKYYNFFVESFRDLFSALGLSFSAHTLQLLVPLGISFFTFRMVSYLLDIEKEKIRATRDIVVFLNYVSFFPTLLSGPIDKAKTFVPQLEREREFRYAAVADGLRQILWGLFKKVAIANNCALLTDQVFANYDSLPASSLFVGAFLYAIQIYADFSGYSDMAIGVSRLLGFEVTRNFAYPYFAQNISDFWRRWHISLTAWLTEYVFTPLSIAFRDYGKAGLIAAIIINMLIVGIWHGANWTYVVYGLLHGLYFIPLILDGTMNKKKKIAKDRLLPSLDEFFRMSATFVLVFLTMVIFRAETVGKAFDFYTRLFSASLFSLPKLDRTTFAISMALTGLMFAFEWFNRENPHGLVLDGTKPAWKRWAIYFSLLSLLLLFGVFAQTQFIYFQF